MTLSELKNLLAENESRAFRLILPDGSDIPHAFHVTEVGHVKKTFIDCGGTLREVTTCQLQVWLGGDEDHRLETAKMAGILRKAASFLTDDSVPVEIEYEHEFLSQYPITHHEVSEEAITLFLTTKHTACLAPELCGLPPMPGAGKFSTSSRSSNCCGPSGCC